MNKPFFTPPLTVPKKVASVHIFTNDGQWHCEIDVDGGRSVVWYVKPGALPGVLLNKAVQWASDRGLAISFVTADITKQVPREGA